MNNKYNKQENVTTVNGVIVAIAVTTAFIFPLCVGALSFFTDWGIYGFIWYFVSVIIVYLLSHKIIIELCYLLLKAFVTIYNLF